MVANLLGIELQLLDLYSMPLAPALCTPGFNIFSVLGLAEQYTIAPYPRVPIALKLCMI